tara:strand:- start:763 stop:1113 length:351 start_codon:yes stop_codon:yes gene_type:complete
MKIKILALLFIISGCAEKKVTTHQLVNLTPPTIVSSMQINRLPHPFNLNGENPYAVWVDGKKLNLDKNQVKDLARSLNLKFEQPEDTAQIHNGEGWLFPIQNLNSDEEEEEIFIDN